MKKLMLSCIALLLSASLVGCSNNDTDKDSNKPEDKTEQKENDAKTDLKEIQKNLDSKKKITATLNTEVTMTSKEEEISAEKFIEEGTYTSDNTKTTVNVTTHIYDKEGTHLSDENITIIAANESVEPQGIGGLYPFYYYFDKFSYYLDATSDITIKESGTNKIYAYQIESPNSKSNFELEVDSNNLPIKLTITRSRIQNEHIQMDESYQFTNFTFE